MSDGYLLLRLVRMNSKAAGTPEDPDLWQVTIGGIMVGEPITLEQATFVAKWFGEGGALKDLASALHVQS